MDEKQAKEEALLYWQEALEYQMRGEFADAIELYLKSIQLHPTAEAPHLSRLDVFHDGTYP